MGEPFEVTKAVVKGVEAPFEVAKAVVKGMDAPIEAFEPLFVAKAVKGPSVVNAWAVVNAWEETSAIAS
jgi:hypothetical protein